MSENSPTAIDEYKLDPYSFSVIQNAVDRDHVGGINDWIEPLKEWFTCSRSR